MDFLPFAYLQKFRQIPPLILSPHLKNMAFTYQKMGHSFANQPFIALFDVVVQITHAVGLHFFFVCQFHKAIQNRTSFTLAVKADRMLTV